MSATIEPGLDLQAYLARVGHNGPIRPSPEVLADLHLAHVGQVPFENLDVLLGRPIHLDLLSLQAKLIQARRGGYCFEQNTLFAAALEQIGFAVTRLAARVRLNSGKLLPRTHMLLRVESASTSWIADVGFGGTGLLMPVPLEEGTRQRQFGWTYRLLREGQAWVLQALQTEGWLDLYAFTLEEQYPVDFEVANHYTSTHPSSIFVQTMTVQLSTPEARHILRNGEYSILTGNSTQTRTVADEEMLELLRSRFGLHFPPGTKFRARLRSDLSDTESQLTDT